MSDTTDSSCDTIGSGSNSEIVRALSTRGGHALAEIFSEYQSRLERMVEFRLDIRLRGRVDAGDVLQEAYIEIARRIGDYIARPEVSFFVWVRQLTWQTLVAVHRRHMGQKRTPNQEVRFAGRRSPDGTTNSIAAMIMGQLTSPSNAAIREEEISQVRDAINSMDETDREVLALRHFEQLGNNEVAEVLGLSKTAASNRYVRALKRLGEIMARLPDFS